MKHFKTSKEIIRTKHFHTYSIWFSQLHFFTCVEIVHNFGDSDTVILVLRILCCSLLNPKYLQLLLPEKILMHQQYVCSNHCQIYSVHSFHPTVKPIPAAAKPLQDCRSGSMLKPRGSGSWFRATVVLETFRIERLKTCILPKIICSIMRLFKYFFLSQYLRFWVQDLEVLS